ncbi:DUF726-domain-containing protein [Rickenella mellea]|uniref:DUF726-domain-containing protein n=1 Tax=Rickenella mellea TaxID=50990 RepID=A0A4Y7QB15_9AGAM|nr:DUF726-domain-containing protein [Rickenella mellea]
MADLEKLSPSRDLDSSELEAVFIHIYRRLAAQRNQADLWASAEYEYSSKKRNAETLKNQFMHELQHWAQHFLKHTWAICEEPGGKVCPQLSSTSDTSTNGLKPLPPHDRLSKVLNAVLFLQVTTSKQYSCRTRTFLAPFGDLDEAVVAATLKDPHSAVQAAEKRTAQTKEEHAERGKAWRNAGIGLGAVAGGVLIGVTGGLAAPLVGAGVTTVLAWLGVGGTAAGLLASGLAGSSAVCGALFGAYGAKSTAAMVERHTREVRDFAFVPVRPVKDTMAVRLCVSGWLYAPEDVTAPWTVFAGDDTYALQWEVEALQKLANALLDLAKSHAMKYVKGQIIKRTVLASLMSSLAPIAWLKLGQIIDRHLVDFIDRNTKDNPWMNAKALATKAGQVLGTLLAERVFGNRPVTLSGYSLGALVIFEALIYLTTLPAAQTLHLVQDVFLFGAPLTTDKASWSAVRRLVSGRLVNGYTEGDYVLAVLQRASAAEWGVAGLQEIGVAGVENVKCEDVEGHLKWRGMVGRCLQRCEAPGIVGEEVEKQMANIAKKIDEEMENNDNDNGEDFQEEELQEFEKGHAL